jgi:hypothetical protein
MSPTAVPTRITIDFRDAIHPSRTWILGLDERGGRVDLLASDPPLARSPEPALPSSAAPSRVWVQPIAQVGEIALPTALSSVCACPEFCERDHANE